MSLIKFANNASSLLAATINAAATTVQVGAGEGALFPSPTGSEYFLVALVNAAGDLEIVKCTSRTGDLLTVVRAQEGTSAATWTNGATRVELRVTKGTMEAMLQKTGDSMSGNLDMGGHNVVDARLTGDTTVVGGQLVGTAIRGVEDDASNEILVPSDGSRATAGGSPILTQGDGVMEVMPVGAIIMWYGSLGSLPAGWQLCNGSNGSPDLRGVFPRGAGGALVLGATGGASAASGTTSEAGAHSHVVTVGGHTLTTAELPAHNHRLLGGSVSGSVTVDGPINNTSYKAVAGCRGSITGDTYDDVENNSSNKWIENTGGGGAHDHTASLDTAADHSHTLSSIATIPPYLAVYFIMKVS